jgi:hypothetical protein
MPADACLIWIRKGGARVGIETPITCSPISTCFGMERAGGGGEKYSVLSNDDRRRVPILKQEGRGGRTLSCRRVPILEREGPEAGMPVCSLRESTPAVAHVLWLEKMR